MSEPIKGILAAALACVIWGFSPIFYKALDHVPPLEVLSHRTLWSLVFFGGVLIVQGRLGEVPRALAGARKLAIVALAAAMITTNWFLFIYAIQLERAVEVSLGYFILPLVSVLAGMVFFQETLSRGKAVALGLATVAVAILTYGLGATPVISLILAVTFSIYGVVKKNSSEGPVVSVTAEVLLLVPIALAWLWGVHMLGWTGLVGRNLAIFGRDMADSVMLILSGPLTASPLILYSYASRRVTMSTSGLVLYLNPCLQFLVAVLIFVEPFTRWHAIAFPLIWLALAIYTITTLRQDRAARRLATSVSTSPTTDTNSARLPSANP